MSKISVVMGSYNQKAVLSFVLPFYETQILPRAEFEVILVDSSSPDGTGEWLKTFQPQFEFRYFICENKGKAFARNFGVSQATGDIIIITDSDMIPDPNFVSAHLSAHQKTVSPSCFEGLAYNLPSLNWPPNPKALVPQVGNDYRNDKKLGWYYFLTGNLSIPKALFKKMNGFDEAFKGYGWEDLELGYRLQKNEKVPLRYLKSAINYHYHVIDPKSEIERNVLKGQSAQLMLKKHPELKLFLGLNPLSIFVFRRVQEDGAWLHFLRTNWLVRDTGLRYRFALWFLKEFYYLKGILNPSF